MSVARDFRKAKVAKVRADIKDMYVDTSRRDIAPFLEVLNGMLKRGHSREGTGIELAG